MHVCVCVYGSTTQLSAPSGHLVNAYSHNTHGADNFIFVKFHHVLYVVTTWRQFAFTLRLYSLYSMCCFAFFLLLIPFFAAYHLPANDVGVRFSIVLCFFLTPFLGLAYRVLFSSKSQRRSHTCWWSDWLGPMGVTAQRLDWQEVVHINAPVVYDLRFVRNE